MTEDERDRTTSAGAFQDSLDRSEPTFFASYGLIGAIVAFGALGYVADRFFNTIPWLLIAGLACGLALGFYGVINASRTQNQL